MINPEIKFENNWEACEKLYWKLHKLKACKDAYEGLWKEETEENGILKDSQHYYAYDSRTSLDAHIQCFANDFNRLIIDYVNNN